MKLAVLCAAVAAISLAAPAFGAQDQNLSMSIQHGTPGTGAANNACDNGHVPGKGTGDGKGATTGTTAHNNSALAGGVNTGLMANTDNCHTPHANHDVGYHIHR